MKNKQILGALLASYVGLAAATFGGCPESLSNSVFDFTYNEVEDSDWFSSDATLEIVGVLYDQAGYTWHLRGSVPVGGGDRIGQFSHDVDSAKLMMETFSSGELNCLYMGSLYRGMYTLSN